MLSPSPIPHPIGLTPCPFREMRVHPCKSALCCSLDVTLNTVSHENDICAPHSFQFISRTFEVAAQSSQNHNMGWKQVMQNAIFFLFMPGNLWSSAWPARLQVLDQGTGWHITLSSQTGRFMTRVSTSSSGVDFVNGDITKFLLHYFTFHARRSDLAGFYVTQPHDSTLGDEKYNFLLLW